MTKLVRPVLVLTAAATLVVGACAPLAPGATQRGVTNAAPTPIPAESTPPSAIATDPGYLTVPSVGCCRGQDLPPGRYEAPPWLYIPLSVDVPAGWRVINESRALLFLLGRGENAQNNPNQMIVLLKANGDDTPESITNGIRGVPQLSETIAPAPVTIAGFEGIQVDLAALPNPSFEGDPEADIPPGVQFLPAIERYFAEGFIWTTSTPEADIRVIALQVGGQVLPIYLEAPPGELDQLASDVAAILESIKLVE